MRRRAGRRASPTNHHSSLARGYRRRVRVLRLVVIALLVATSAGVSDLATAAPSTRAERDRVRREQAQKAAELDVLRAEDGKVTAALRAMSAEVRAHEQQLVAAEQAVSVSDARAAEAESAEEAMEARVVALQASLRDMAVQEFITGGRLKIDTLAYGPDDLAEVARRSVLADVALGSTTVISQELRAASEDLTVAREAADDAAAAAVARRDALDTRLAELAAARDQQAAFAERLDARIESRLAEAAALAALDAKLSAEIVRQQAALARANVGRRGTTRTVVRGSVPLRTVRGITVHRDIADDLERLLDAAEADGLRFGGGGYRDPEDQERLREAHCPDPEDSPSTSCHPPTARPGHSMHERGLAIDFTEDGVPVRSGSAGYRWLRANAATYGLYNLPGEPWHWSTNGS